MKSQNKPPWARKVARQRYCQPQLQTSLKLSKLTCQLLAWMEATVNLRPSNGSIGEHAGALAYKLDTTTSSQPSSDIANDDSPATSPPYWVQPPRRSFSNISIESMQAGAITLQDNTDEGDSKNKACWARSVYIEDHVVVNGSRTNIGAFVVWNVNVDTLRVGHLRQA